MTTQVVTVGAQMPLPEVARQLIDARADRLIVLDERGRPVGLVSATDVLNAIVSPPRDDSPRSG